MSGLGIVLTRTLLIYFFVLVTLRLMGKREIGKLSLFDLVVSIMIAELAVVVIEDTKMPLTNGLAPIIVLMLIQIGLSYLSLKSKKIRELVEGQPSILISEGKIRDGEMKKQRYTIDDLMTQLREKNIKNIADVEFAILETSGKLSVFPKPYQNSPAGLPIPLISDGRVLDRNLVKLKKDHDWLEQMINEKGYQSIDEIYFLSIDNNSEIYLDPKDN